MIVTSEYNERLYARLSKNINNPEVLIDEMKKCGGLISGKFTVSILFDQEYEGDIPILIPVSNKDRFLKFLEDTYADYGIFDDFYGFYSSKYIEMSSFYNEKSKINVLFILTDQVSKFLERSNISFSRVMFDGDNMIFEESVLNKEGTIPEYFLRKGTEYSIEQCLNFLKQTIKDYPDFKVTNLDVLKKYYKNYGWLENYITDTSSNGPRCPIDEPDFRKLFEVIYFYKIRFFTEELYDELKKFGYEDVKDVIAKIEDDQEKKFYYKILRFVGRGDRNLCNIAAESGDIDMLIYSGKKNWSVITCQLASENGNLNCLTYLYKNGCPWSSISLKLALVNGEVECAKFLYENGCQFGKDATEYINRVKNIDCVKFMQSIGYQPTREAIINAIENNRPELLEYLCDQGIELTHHMFTLAVTSGNLECVKILHNKKCHCPPSATEMALSRKHIKIFEFLKENGYQCNNYWLSMLCLRNHTDLLDLVYTDDPEILERAFQNSVKNASLEALQFLMSKGHSLCPKLMEYAVLKGNLKNGLKSMKFLFENGCPWSEGICELAGFVGNLECLKFAHENGCSWNEKSTKLLAVNCVKCLEYAHKNGCYWNQSIIIEAAVYGNLETFKYAHLQGLEVNDEVLKFCHSEEIKNYLNGV